MNTRTVYVQAHRCASYLDLKRARVLGRSGINGTEQTRNGVVVGQPRRVIMLVERYMQLMRVPRNSALHRGHLRGCYTAKLLENVDLAAQDLRAIEVDV